MKKLLAIILMLSMVLLCACSAPDSSGNSSPSTIDIPDTSYTDSTSQTESGDTLEGENSEEESSEDASDATIVSDRDKKDQENNVPGTGKLEGTTKETEYDDTPKETLPSQSSGDNDSSESSKPTETSKPESKPPETTTTQAEPTESKTETTQPPAEETVPTEPRAGAADTAAVAQRVLEYINQYRSSPATRLSGLTEYAQYRSRQLVSNFAHNTADQRAAATALQYGEYVDPSVFGGSGQPYYRANAREAIAKAGYVGTIDEVAQKLATLVKNSPNHWNYIGDSQYCYIAVGVTYESDMWYCAITVASENTDDY